MLRNNIKTDADVALKMGDSKKVGALRYLLSVIDKKALTLPPDSFRDREEVAVLQKELKNKEEARELFAKANRTDLVAEQDYEIEVLKKYLPEAMDEEELGKIVDEVITLLCKDIAKPYPGSMFGSIMREVGNRVSGKAEGSLIAKVVKAKLS